MKAIDHTGMPIRSKARRKTKTPSNMMFKLRDPVTGLYWGVSQASDPSFNLIGKQWGNIRAAKDNWAEYMYQRVLLDDDHPRHLELVTFKIAVTEKKSSSDGCPDMTTAALLAANTNRNDLVVTFAKKTAKENFVISHIIECREDGLEIPKHLDVRVYRLPMRNNWNLSGKAEPMKDITLIAVGNDTDFVYLKMALSDYISQVWDMAKIVAG
jgi:hypothetical protein